MKTLSAVIRWDEESIYLNQLVVHHRGRWSDDYVVVDIGDREITIVDPDFENIPRTLSYQDWSDDDFEVKTADDGTPVWAY